MMIRTLLLAAALLAALSTVALAVTDAETSTLTVTVPNTFDLSASGSVNAAFGTLNASDIAAGDSHVYTATSTGNLVVLSNYNSTTLTALLTTNFAAGFVVTVKARTYNANGTANSYITILNNGAPTAAQTVASWGVSGVSNLALAPVSYQMQDVSAADDAGSYSAVVTYTLTGV